MDLPNRTELFETMITEAVAFHEGRLTETILRQPGSDANTLLMAGVAMGDEVCYQIYQAIKNSNPRTAEGSRLHQLLFDWFGLTRKGAASAVVPVVLTRTGTTEGTIPAGTPVWTTGNVVFNTVTDADFGISDTTATVTATAIVAGTSGNVLSGTITQITPPTWDTSFTVTNIERAVGGCLTETDADFRHWVAEFWNVQQKATAAAIVYGALSVDGVAHASISEIPIDAYTAYVELIVADTDGNGNSTLLANVDLELDNWRACGIFVETISGTRVDLPIALTFSYKVGYDQLTVNKAVKQTILNYVNSRRLGESIDPAVIKAFVAKVTGVAGSIVVTLPSAEVVATASQIIRTTAPNITCN